MEKIDPFVLWRRVNDALCSNYLVAAPDDEQQAPAELRTSRLIGATILLLEYLVEDAKQCVEESLGHPSDTPDRPSSIVILTKSQAVAHE